MKETVLKIIGLILLALLCLWVCLKASGAPVLRSPKDAGNQPIRLTLPKLVIVPTGTLSWQWSPDSNNPMSNVVFRVYQTPDLKQPLAVVAVVSTNVYPFFRSTPMQYFSVQPSNTVTHLVPE